MRRRVLDAVILLVVAANGWHFAVCVCRYVGAHHHRTHAVKAYVDRDLTNWLQSS